MSCEECSKLRARIRELEQSEAMSFGCFGMIAEDLAQLDPSTDPKPVPPMMLNDWMRKVIKDAAQGRVDGLRSRER
jgi:hypothetical protein